MKRLATILAIAALAAAAPLCAVAQDAAARLISFEAGISTGDPALAASYLEDDEVLALAERDAARAGAYRARAEALKDLNRLLNMDWTAAQANTLSEALAPRIDVNRPLSRVGVGPEPEKLLSWLTRFKPAYPASKTATVKKAIRQWEVVFGTRTATHVMNWGMADGASGRSMTLTKADWEAYTIRERNAVIATLVKNKQYDFWQFDDNATPGMRGQMSLQADVDTVRSSGLLTPAQVAALNGKSLEDQLYLLGSYFDGGAASGVPADLRMRVDAARTSLPGEVLTASQRQTLGTMLNTAVAAELTGTKAGARVLASGPLRISVAPLDGTYSSYDAATGTIILDSETIQQYMRLKGYTAASVISDPTQLSEIAKYMSPAVVYEGAHLMQARWAASAGVYHPHTQEDEIEAMSLEGLYTTEKISRDSAFASILSGARDYSAYATKRAETATEFNSSGSKMFATTVRQRFYAGLPSLDASAALVLDAVNGELTRRAALSDTERAAIDATALSLAEAMEMSPEELSGSVEELHSSVLTKLRTDLSSMSVYRKYYSASDRAIRSDQAALNEAPPAISPGPKVSIPPAL